MVLASLGLGRLGGWGGEGSGGGPNAVSPNLLAHMLRWFLVGACAVVGWRGGRRGSLVVSPYLLACTRSVGRLRPCGCRYGGAYGMGRSPAALALCACAVVDPSGVCGARCGPPIHRHRGCGPRIPYLSPLSWGTCAPPRPSPLLTRALVFIGVGSLGGFATPATLDDD